MALLDTERRELDLVFDVLSHTYRRRVLQRISEMTDGDEDAFVPEAVATENDDIESLNIELFHRHLPKLDQAGYVDWDRDGHTISRGARYEEIAPLMNLIQDHRDELFREWP